MQTQSKVIDDLLGTLLNYKIEYYVCQQANVDCNFFLKKNIKKSPYSMATIANRQ